jgi:hypothetical protein
MSESDEWVDGYEVEDGSVVEVRKIDTGNQVATVRSGVNKTKVLKIQIGSGQVRNDGKDALRVDFKVLDGLSYAEGREKRAAGNFTAKLQVDDTTTEVKISNGTGSRKLKTEKPAGSEIKLRAKDLKNEPATPSEEKTVEVVE